MRSYLSCLFAIIVTGCGGGGGGTSGGITPSGETQIIVSGTAATGAAMDNADITLKCQKTTFTTSSDAQGKYSKSISSSELPCLLRASKGTLQLHSVAGLSVADITVNITPQTDLIASHLLGVDSTTAFDSNQTPDKSNLSTFKISESINVVRQSIVALVNTDGYDPISLKFNIGDDYDKKLDQMQLSLAQKKIDLNFLKKALTVTLQNNGERVSYVLSVVNSAGVSKVDGVTKEFISESAQWISGSDVNGGNYFGFFLNRLVDKKFQINEFSYNSSGGYLTPAIQSCDSSRERMLTVSGNWQQPVCAKPILAGAVVTFNEDESEFGIKLNTENNDLVVGKWKLNAVARSVSGSAISEAFDPVYLGNKDGKFSDGSKSYKVLITAIDSEFLVGRDKITESTTTTDQFTEKYKQQIFCGIPIERYTANSASGAGNYGVKFSSIASKAQLIPVDGNCLQVVDGYPLIDLDWKVTSVNNQAVVELSGAKLPSYRAALGQIGGSYDASETNPSLRYWTDKYKFIIVRNPDSTLYTGIKTVPGASIDVTPGNGPYLNKAALNSMLNLVGYPRFSQ